MKIKVKQSWSFNKELVQTQEWQCCKYCIKY